jgi:hypothetical protein
MNSAISQAIIKNAIKKTDPVREVVVSGWGHTRNNSYWHVKTDSTCGDLGYKKDTGGFEVASFVASGYKDLCAVGRAVNALRVAGAQVNKNCGLHIHADIRDYSFKMATQLLANWLRIEPIVYEAVPEHRRENIYCVSMRKKIKLGKLDYLSSTELQSRLGTHTAAEHDRRVSLNFCNYVQGGDIRTVELRLPESTLNHYTVKHWIRLFINFVAISKRAEVKNNEKKRPDITKYGYDYDDTELLAASMERFKKYAPEYKEVADKLDVSPANLTKTLEILGLQGSDQFYILSKHLRATKIWFLRRILKYSTNLSLIDEAKKTLGDLIY